MPRWVGAAAFGAAAALCAEPAEAARLTVDIAPKTYSEALIDLALRAHVSLVGAEACHGEMRAPLRGQMDLETALRRLLADSGCGFRLTADGTVQILPRTATTAAARPSAPPEPAVSELLVTATKRRQLRDDVAGSVSVIPRDQLSATLSRDAGDASGQAAGMIMTNLGPGRDKLLLRGLSDGVFTGRARSPTASYLDDAPINYDAPDPDLRLTDVERVEVLRGPQGSLYGGGAIAGIYRIVTRKPDVDGFAGQVSASLATTHGGSPSNDIEGFVNLPLARGLVALRLVGYTENQGGYIDDLAMKRANVDRTVRRGARAALRVAPANGWTVDVSGVWQHLRSSDAQYTNGPVSLTRTSRIAEAHDNHFTEGAVNVQGQLGGAEFSSATTLVRHKFSSVYDASAALDLFSDPLAQLGVYQEPRRVRMLAQDFVLHSAGSRRLDWLAGLYIADAREDSPAALEAMFAGMPIAPLYNEARTDRLRTTAVYGEATYAFTRRWKLVVGGRLGQARLATSSQVHVALPGRDRTLRKDATFSGVLPKISLQRDIGAGGLVYALYSTGVRPGGFNSGGLTAPSPVRAAFSPDRLENFEVGAKLARSRFSLRTAVFFDRWQNIQTDRYLSSGLAYTANVGDADIFGLEAEGGWRPTDRLSLEANVLLTGARFTRRNPDFAQRLSDGLPGTPPVSGGVLAAYRRPLTDDVALRLIAQARYIGRSDLTFDASQSRDMGGYVDAQLSAALIRGHYAAQLYVSNPTNSARDTFAYGNPFSFGQVRQATPQRPRTIGLAITATY